MSKDWIADVREFHEKHGVPVLEKLEAPAPARMKLRYDLIREEVENELIPVLWNLRVLLEEECSIDEQEFLTQIADGIADSIVVLIGTALEFGIPLDKVWDEVHRSNMTKEVGDKREDGKVLKGKNFSLPDLESILRGDH